MSTKTLTKLPLPSQVRKMPIDENRWYVEGLYHGLSSNGLCVTCRAEGRSQMFTIADCKAPRRSALKYLPKRQNRYWSGFWDAKGTDQCFECIREPQSPKAVDLVTLQTVYGLNLHEARDLIEQLNSEHINSKPVVRPWIDYRDFRAANSNLSPSALLDAWLKVIESSPRY